jgi:hypothetical protein
MTTAEWTQLVDLLHKAWDDSSNIALPYQTVVNTQADVFFAAKCEAEKRMEGTWDNA